MSSVSQDRRGQDWVGGCSRGCASDGAVDSLRSHSGFGCAVLTVRRDYCDQSQLFHLLKTDSTVLISCTLTFACRTFVLNVIMEDRKSVV